MKEYSPNIYLQRYIDKYWVMQGFFAEEQRVSIAADGCIDIIFASGDAASERTMKEYHPYIVGTMDTWSPEIFRGDMSMIGIRFNPVGITAFIKAQVDEFTNDKIDLMDIDSLFDKDFYLPLQENNSIEEKLEYINLYLIQKLPYLFNIEERILHAVNYISKNKGQKPVKEVVENICMNSRQFERLFKASVGISAKTYSRVARLHNTLEYMKACPQDSLFSIALECGYYDHSHLIKDFNILAGKSLVV